MTTARNFNVVYIPQKKIHSACTEAQTIGDSAAVIGRTRAMLKEEAKMTIWYGRAAYVLVPVRSNTKNSRTIRNTELKF